MAQVAELCFGCMRESGAVLKLAQVDVGRGDFRHEKHNHIAVVLDVGFKVCGAGFDLAPYAPYEIDLPGGVEPCGQEVGGR